ncbi:sigma-70 family RNA polymerase sigma factor [Mycolicibacterium sp.]|uniref:sigma-70 family RNA polymerase sigma factor n=1 Tax=Mycolicibacterium sp. TaxID=2320850 RepID=UPI003D0E776B
MTTRTGRDDRTRRFEEQAIPILAGMYRHAFKMTRAHADAEDLLQETAVKAFASFDSFTQGTNLAGWLYRIMANTHISEFHKQQRRPTLVLTDEFSDGQLMARSQRAAEDQVLAGLGEDSISEAMHELPETFRAAVYYADVEGLKVKDIAALTEVPLGTAMSRLHRGRKQLRRSLSGVAKDFGYPLPDAACESAAA